MLLVKIGKRFGGEALGIRGVVHAARLSEDAANGKNHDSRSDPLRLDLTSWLFPVVLRIENEGERATSQ